MLLQPFRVAATTAAADVVALLKTVLPPLAPAIMITCVSSSACLFRVTFMFIFPLSSVSAYSTQV